MKAVMTMDPRLLKLVGDKLYSSHPLPIVVRELLQNARDACFRKGVKPDLRIVINRGSGEDVTVTCEDNGIGMTDEQLVKDFLCLGNTSKMEELGAVGGFGIAKAALMRNPQWEVHSLGFYMDQSFLLSGADIQEAPFLDGTKITVHITDWTSKMHVEQALAMIYLSDVTVDLTLMDMGETYHDPEAGWGGWDIHALDCDDTWEAYRIDKLEKVGPMNLNYKKLTIARLSGLVQFARYESWTDREFNVLFELHPMVRPDDKEYPLTMSREEWAGSAKDKIRALLDTCNANPKTVEVADRERLTVLYDGYLMRGKRNMQKFDLTEADLFEELVKDKYDEQGQEHKHIRVYLENYDKDKRNLHEDKKVLAIWKELIIECADNSDIFGIGLIVNRNIRAAQIWDSGSRFYLINPDVVLSAQSLEAKVHLLHLIACHETAHHFYPNHGEMHTDLEGQIYGETIDIIQDDMKRLTQALR